MPMNALYIIETDENVYHPNIPNTTKNKTTLVLNLYNTELRFRSS